MKESKSASDEETGWKAKAEMEESKKAPGKVVTAVIACLCCLCSSREERRGEERRREEMIE